MKKPQLLIIALTATCAVSAQGYYTDAHNPDITRHTGRIARSVWNSCCPR